MDLSKYEKRDIVRVDTVVHPRDDGDMEGVYEWRRGVDKYYVSAGLLEKELLAILPQPNVARALELAMNFPRIYIILPTLEVFARGAPG